MAYKVGHRVDCLFYIEKGRKKLFFGEMPTDKKLDKVSCEILSINPIGRDCDEKLYMLLVPNDFVGWMITKFRVERQGVDKKYLNHKFYEVNEYYLNREIQNDV